MSFAEPASFLSARPAPAMCARRMLAAGAIGIAAGALAQTAPQVKPALIAASALFVLWRMWRAQDVRALILPTLAGLSCFALAMIYGDNGAVLALVLWRWLDLGLADRTTALRLRSLQADKRLDPAGASAALFWLTPAWGLSFRLAQAAGSPLLDLLTFGLGVAAGVSLFAWLLRRLADWRLGELAAPHAASIGLHHTMFVAGFVLTPDPMAGLILLEFWRGAQDMLTKPQQA